MPIKKYIPDTTFGPETVKDMTTAFERIRSVLKLKDPDDPLIEVVAKKVISLVRIAVGGDPAYPALVLFHAVSRRRRLRLNLLYPQERTGRPRQPLQSVAH